MGWLDEMVSRSVHRLHAAGEIFENHSSVAKELERVTARSLLLEGENRRLASDAQIAISENSLLKISEAGLKEKMVEMESVEAVRVAGLERRIAELSSEKAALEVKHSVVPVASSGSLEELETLKSELLKRDSRIAELEEFTKHLQGSGRDADMKLMSLEGERAQATEELSRCKLLLDQSASDIQWVLREGIPGSLVHLLKSPEYSQANVQVQAAWLEYGLHKGCAEMKQRYLSGVPEAVPLYSYPDAFAGTRSWLAALASKEFSFLRELHSGAISLSVLKEMLRGESWTGGSEIASSVIGDDGPQDVGV